MTEVIDYLDKRIAAVEKAVLYNFGVIGERVLNAARSTNSYKDQTGNLRSSIGYVIVKDGRIVQSSDFAVVKDGDKGNKEGKAFARELAREYDKGIVLIVVAGMNYGVHVSNKGKDVLESAELLAEKLVPRMLATLGLTQK